MTQPAVTALSRPGRGNVSGEAIGFRMQRVFAWSGIVFIVIMGIGFALIGKMIPPPAPGDSATQTAHFFLGNMTRIRLGMIVSAFDAALFVPLSAVISLQIRRIEGRTPLLSMVQFASGSLLSLEFIYLIFFWQTAAFRADRAPQLVQLLNDMAWIPYMGLSCTLVMQAAAIGWAALMDKRADPVFPRWFGYYQFWAAFLFLPGTFNVFFHHGPLAWNGLIAFYMPIPVFASWAILTPVMVLRAIKQQEAEEAASSSDAADGDLHASYRAELDALQIRIESIQSSLRTS